jgi:hypothetical protein
MLTNTGPPIAETVLDLCTVNDLSSVTFLMGLGWVLLVGSALGVLYGVRVAGLKDRFVRYHLGLTFIGLVGLIILSTAL